jgi:hypothetical protein
LIPDIRALTKLKREANQQKRIANGINNGSLNAHEAANLEKREAGLQKLGQRDMAKAQQPSDQGRAAAVEPSRKRIGRSIDRDQHNNR